MLKSYVRNIVESYICIRAEEDPKLKKWVASIDERIDEGNFFKASLEELQDKIIGSFGEWFDIKDCEKQITRFAERQTLKDTKQAMEAMVHNFCTMNCLAPTEEFWVYDTAFHAWVIYSAEEFSHVFTPGRFYALSMNLESGDVELKPITGAWESPNDKPMVKITDKSGASFTTTHDHRYLTVTDDCEFDYVEAKDLAYTVHPRNFKLFSEVNYVEADVTQFVKREESTMRYKRPTIPYSLALAELLGYYVSDGYISPDGATLDLAVYMKVMPEHLLELCEQAFGFTPTYRIRTRVDSKDQNNIHDIFISVGVKIGRLMRHLAGAGADGKHVPNFVLHGSWQMQNAFLHGYLTCDGARKGRNYIEFSTVSKWLVYDLKMLFAARGELLHVRRDSCEGLSSFGGPRRPIWTGILGAGAAKRLGLQYLINGARAAFEIPRYDTQPIVRKIKEAKIPWGDLPRVPRREPWNIRYEEFNQIEMSDALRESLVPFTKCFRVPVTKIEPAEDCPVVYDIEVADNANFITASGFIVHNSRHGAQTPFSSANMGLDVSWAGRAVTSAMLDAVDAGLGLGETAIFPITIFKMKKGITDEGSPNYDLFKKSIRVSAKRMYPNWVNVDTSFNLPFYKEDVPATHISTMGAVYHGMVTIKLIDDQGFWEDTFDMDISRVGELLMQYPWAIKGECKYIDFDPETRYFNVDDKHVKIYDSIRKGWVGIRKYMVFENKKKNWREVTFNGVDDPGFEVKMKFTEDHPLPLYVQLNDEPVSAANFVRTPVEELKIGDKIPRALCEGCGDFKFLEVTAIRKCKRRHTGYDFETNSDHFDAGNISNFNCRTRVINNYFDPEHQITEGRGNIFWTTIDLPMLALDATHELPKNPDPVGTFFKKLDTVIDSVIEYSLDRFHILGRRRAKNFPFMMGQHEYCTSKEKLKSPEDEILEVIKEGTLSIGFIGLAETLIALTGKHHAESLEAQELGLKIISHMKDRTDEATKKYNLNFSLMASPAEGCTGRLQRLIRKKYGVIKGITDKEYLTNSFHVKPEYKISIWDKIAVEAPYHKYCLAGAIFYAELDTEATKNLVAMEQIINRIAESDIGYFALNHPLTRDPICGYVGPMRPDGTCPRCGRKEFEGVPASKLLSLSSYTPDPEYAITAPKIEDKDKTFNSI